MSSTAFSGKVFRTWDVTTGGITLADATQKTITFAMPENAVELTTAYNYPSIRVMTRKLANINTDRRLSDIIAEIKAQDADIVSLVQVRMAIEGKTYEDVINGVKTEYPYSLVVKGQTNSELYYNIILSKNPVTKKAEKTLGNSCTAVHAETVAKGKTFDVIVGYDTIPNVSDWVQTQNEASGNDFLVLAHNTGTLTSYGGKAVYNTGASTNGNMGIMVSSENVVAVDKNLVTPALGGNGQYSEMWVVDLVYMAE